MKKVRTIVYMLGIAFATLAMGSDYGSLEERVVKSANGQFALHINTSTGRHEVRKDDAVLWSFDRQVWVDDYFLSNDGKYVLWVAWKYLKVDDVANQLALVAFSRDGVVMQRTVEELAVPQTVNGIQQGSLVDTLRTWRTLVTQEGDTVSIKVTGKRKPVEVNLSEVGSLHDFTCLDCEKKFHNCDECNKTSFEHRGLNHVPQHKNCKDVGDLSKVN